MSSFLVSVYVKSVKINYSSCNNGGCYLPVWSLIPTTTHEYIIIATISSSACDPPPPRLILILICILTVSGTIITVRRIHIYRAEDLGILGCAGESFTTSSKVWFFSSQVSCTATKISFIYSFSGNSAASAPISTFMCLWAIYIVPGSVYSTYCLQQNREYIKEYINRSRTHECGNWDWDPNIPFLGIFVSKFRYFVFAVLSAKPYGIP